MPFMTRKDVPVEIRSRHNQLYVNRLRELLRDPSLEPDRRKKVLRLVKEASEKMAAENSQAPEPEKAPVEIPIASMLKNMKKAELQELATVLGLDDKGTKKVLQGRIEEARGG